MKKYFILIGIIFLNFHHLLSQSTDFEYKDYYGFFIYIDPSNTKFLVMDKKVRKNKILKTLYKDSTYDIFFLSDLIPKWNVQLREKGIQVDLSDTVSIVMELDPYVGYLSYGKLRLKFDVNRKYNDKYLGISKWFTINKACKIPYSNILDYGNTVSVIVKYPKKMKRWLDPKTSKNIEYE